jgi:hypothetical protein
LRPKPELALTKKTGALALNPGIGYTENVKLDEMKRN